MSNNNSNSGDFTMAESTGNQDSLLVPMPVVDKFEIRRIQAALRMRKYRERKKNGPKLTSDTPSIAQDQADDHTRSQSVSDAKLEFHHQESETFQGKEEPEFDPSLSEDERNYYKKTYPALDLVRERRLHCTVCKTHIGTAPSVESTIKMHPVLRVTHCTKCDDFYNSGEFSKGEDGSELYCRWCGQGGDVYCCSSCPYVFCKSCITKNLSHGVVADIEQNDNWSCFSCSPKILWPLRAQHWALVKYIAEQKKEIKEGNFSESEVSKRMNEDRSTCCRLAKRKCGNMSDAVETIVLPPLQQCRVSSGSDLKRSQKSPGISPLPKRQKTSYEELAAKSKETNVARPGCKITPIPNTPSARTVMAPANPAQRIMTSSSNPTYSFTQVQARPGQAPGQTVVRQTVIGQRTSSSTGTTPLYHTINGFNIDMNSAAQHETFRLPNGKLIQVQRQGPSQQQNTARVTSTATVPAQSSMMQYQRPQNNLPPPLTQVQPRRIQITATSGGVPQYRQITTMPAQQVQRYHNVGAQNNNPQILQNGAIQTVRMINGMPTAPPVQQVAAAQPPPLAAPQPTLTATTNRFQLIRQVFDDSPVGEARTQLQVQVFAAMEICTHLGAKIQSLTNSTAYKTAHSYLEIKELYIHMSYMITYGIDRFKNLQDKCLADMRQLGFTNDAESLSKGQLAADKQASDDEDNEIEIVEPKTDLITLDSDDEDAPAIKKEPNKQSNQNMLAQKVIQPGQNNQVVNQSAPGQPQSLTLFCSSGRLVQIEPHQSAQTQVHVQLPQQIGQAQSLPQTGNVPPNILVAQQPPPLVPAATNLQYPNVSLQAATSTTPSGLLQTPLGANNNRQQAIQNANNPDFSENVDFNETAHNFLSSMLEVNIHEDSEATSVKSKKQPRKKTTNRPNPQLLELERQRLEEMKRNDAKLKKKCTVSLKKVEEEFPYLKTILANEKERRNEDSNNESEDKDIDSIVLSTDSDEASDSPKKNQNKLDDDSPSSSKSLEKSSEKPLEESLDKSPEKPSEKSLEKSTDNSSEKDDDNKDEKTLSKENGKEASQESCLLEKESLDPKRTSDDLENDNEKAKHKGSTEPVTSINLDDDENESDHNGINSETQKSTAPLELQATESINLSDSSDESVVEINSAKGHEIYEQLVKELTIEDEAFDESITDKASENDEQALIKETANLNEKQENLPSSTTEDSTMEVDSPTEAVPKEIEKMEVDPTTSSNKTEEVIPDKPTKSSSENNLENDQPLIDEASSSKEKNEVDHLQSEEDNHNDLQVNLVQSGVCTANEQIKETSNDLALPESSNTEIIDSNSDNPVENLPKDVVETLNSEEKANDKETPDSSKESPICSSPQKSEIEEPCQDTNSDTAKSPDISKSVGDIIDQILEPSERLLNTLPDESDSAKASQTQDVV